MGLLSSCQAVEDVMSVLRRATQQRRDTIVVELFLLGSWCVVGGGCLELGVWFPVCGGGLCK